MTFEIEAADAAVARCVGSELSGEMDPYETSEVVVDGASIRVPVGFTDAFMPDVVADYAAAKVRRVLRSAGRADWPVTRSPAPR